MESWVWGDHCNDLEELLGGFEDQGWCLACREFGHTVAICPFQEEEKEPDQEVKDREEEDRLKARNPG
ncbi:UNVERIFIED_CONTAM: hypothetical protein FKN15_027662 [Acipenser sinensis]